MDKLKRFLNMEDKAPATKSAESEEEEEEEEEDDFDAPPVAAGGVGIKIVGGAPTSGTVGKPELKTSAGEVTRSSTTHVVESSSTVSEKSATTTKSTGDKSAAASDANKIVQSDQQQQQLAQQKQQKEEQLQKQQQEQQRQQQQQQQQQQQLQQQQQQERLRQQQEKQQQQEQLRQQQEQQKQQQQQQQQQQKQAQQAQQTAQTKSNPPPNVATAPVPAAAKNPTAAKKQPAIQTTPQSAAVSPKQKPGENPTASKQPAIPPPQSTATDKSSAAAKPGGASMPKWRQKQIAEQQAAQQQELQAASSGAGPNTAPGQTARNPPGVAAPRQPIGPGKLGQASADTASLFPADKVQIVGQAPVPGQHAIRDFVPHHNVGLDRLSSGAGGNPEGRAMASGIGSNLVSTIAGSWGAPSEENYELEAPHVIKLQEFVPHNTAEMPTHPPFGSALYARTAAGDTSVGKLVGEVWPPRQNEPIISNQFGFTITTQQPIDETAWVRQKVIGASNPDHPATPWSGGPARAGPGKLPDVWPPPPPQVIRYQIKPDNIRSDEIWQPAGGHGVVGRGWPAGEAVAIQGQHAAPQGQQISG